MSCIEREAVHSIIEQTSTFAFTRGKMHEQIDLLPVADVAPVVRCRECRHSQEYLDEELFCMCFEDVVPLDGYCHKGERKEVDHGE